MKKLIYFILIALFSTSFTHTKGGSGKYKIKGIAMSKSGQLLKNELFTISIGEKVFDIKTDSLGNYSFIVEWRTTCPSKLSEKERNKRNKALNPEKIKIQWKHRTVFIKNNWSSMVQKRKSWNDIPIYQKELRF